MKKVIVPFTREEAKHFCDKHPDIESFTQVKTNSWYGSKFDGQTITIDMCDQCFESFLNSIKENFGSHLMDCN